MPKHMKPLRQRGSLFQYTSPAGVTYWKGRFRVTTTGAKRREKWITIAPVAEMQEADARRRLDQIVSRANIDGERTRTLGVSSALNHMICPADTLTATRTKRAMQNIRGGIGVVSELLVSADLISKGFEVFRALNPQSTCDLVCLASGEFLRVEVKTAPAANGRSSVCVDLTGQIGNFDVLAVVFQDGRISYVSAGEATEITRVSVGLREFPVNRGATP